MTTADNTTMERKSTRKNNITKKAANYGFAYGVYDPSSGNDFGHQEERKDDVTRGSYYVKLPTGRSQKVSYTSDKDGYFPVITYE